MTSRRFETTAGELLHGYKDWTEYDYGGKFPARLGIIKRLDGLPIRFAVAEENEIPNRLYGAQINADGDAV